MPTSINDTNFQRTENRKELFDIDTICIPGRKEVGDKERKWGRRKKERKRKEKRKEGGRNPNPCLLP